MHATLLKRKDILMKKPLLPIGILFVLMFTSPFSALADDVIYEVLYKLNQIEESLANLTNKIDSIDKRLAAIEKELVKAPKKETKASSRKPKITPKEAVPDGPGEFVGIGGGCLLGNLTYKASLGNTTFSGEIENQSFNNYKTVIFNLKVFNKKNFKLGGSDFYLQELYSGAKVTFEVTIFGVNINSIAGYEINFVRGF